MNLKMKCQNCKKECHVSYYNKTTKMWECQKCTHYLKKAKNDE